MTTLQTLSAFILLKGIHFSPVMLQQGRYTYSHNHVLSEMCSHLNKMLTKFPECKLSADLEGRHLLDGNIIPPSVVPTTRKPVIVIVDYSCKSNIIAEHTTSFETNTSKSHEYKTNKYSNLMHGIAGQGYNCKFLAIEIDSRGR